MIRLNISVVFSVLFYVNFVNSIPHNDAALQMYKTNLRYRSRMVQDKEELYLEYETNPKYNICNKPREVKAAICRNVIIRLRTREGEEYSNLFVNYLAFIVGEPCSDVKVWINDGELLANQQVMNCFGSSLIMSPGSSKEMVYFYRKIVIHPWNSNHLFVFEYNEDKNYYKVLLLHHLQWRTQHGASGLIFSTPMPLRWGDIVQNLYNILSPIHSKLNKYSTNENNIVNSKTKWILWRICYVAFRVENFGKVLNRAYQQIKIPESNELLAILRDPNSLFYITVSIRAYSCDRTVAKDEFMRKFYIAAGPGDHSVILLEEIESSNRSSSYYEIIDFVEYLTMDYLNFYFKFLY